MQATYKLLGVARREAHAITRLSLVVEVSPALKEAEHAVKEWVETTSFLCHGQEHLVKLGNKARW